ncbi:tRNA uridine-5-carboxymethylaminomethyl(34) synthesis enzyme MnmG [Candidatus Vidania fulgoroideae]|uniref:tRNA uridine-5-carboxymethylaminomethyl(34) synthesis enzyme MnmG n=1 Tax=Candidatus Vidania fulgoroideorum TaxID=881286 RepID=A0A974X974_9PROT|nr:tRNA uridine-5-carboxymethylaminomethyl(34) synthesis enzyme MnmG [Candidatus Vidania fulgoroideae]
MIKEYHVVIIGGGHAGVEASNICSKLGLKTLLITNSIDNISKISCNPSIGGVGKSQIVSEINAVGGIMPRIADKSGLNFKTLNTSKGKSVRSTRIQVDKYIYSRCSKFEILKNRNLNIIQQDVIDINIKKGRVTGVVLNFGYIVNCYSAIITSGTFLNCKVFIGSKTIKSSRDNENNSSPLSNKLRYYINGIGSFKTGTPPRIDSRTIDFSKLKEIKSDIPIPFFHKKRNNVSLIPSCWEGSTNLKTEYVVRSNINKSSIYGGILNSIGPRYCPSIEDKYIRFPHNRRHTIFLELECRYGNEVYLGGLSTSFDFLTQYKLVRSVVGLERSLITRFGYSIEYDFFNPKYLKKSLESKYVNGLFLAGQVNGTTGYEEAAAQGLVAGINCNSYIKDIQPIYFNHNESYIGILIKDITSNGISEPYRMFTSRAKNRIKMRQDNSRYRLNDFLFSNKLIKRKGFNAIKNKELICNDFITYSKSVYVKYKGIKESLYKLILANKENTSIFMKKPIISKSIRNFGLRISFSMFDFIESEIKYRGYYKHKSDTITHLDLRKVIDFNKVKNLSNETREKIIFNNVHSFYDLEKIKNIRYTCLESVRNYIRKHHTN